MHEIENVIERPHFALAVGRYLGVGEARQSGGVDATKLTVDVGSLLLRFASGDDARIFARPVEPGPGEQLRAAVR
jgi:hypothetical protein